MKAGRSGMGSRKHAKSGTSGPGPRTKLAMKLTSERSSITAHKPKDQYKPSVRDLMHPPKARQRR